MKFKFGKGNWNEADLPYASSYRFDGNPKFTVGEDFVENKSDENGPCGWEWITAISEEKFQRESTIKFVCDFDGPAAPLLVLAKEIDTDAEGNRKYGNYFEIVIWKNGVNVWEMDYDPARATNGGVAWKLRMGVSRSFAEGERHTVEVNMTGDRLNVKADGELYRLYLPDMYDSFHVGISACEGHCRFYELSVN